MRYALCILILASESSRQAAFPNLKHPPPLPLLHSDETSVLHILNFLSISSRVSTSSDPVADMAWWRSLDTILSFCRSSCIDNRWPLNAAFAAVQYFF
ncbi:hypothetical protein B0H10DRAFT_65210 [Mycena sp. CBHHK59/15]|nr:hypothetical protein B0H10DRAFT_65210 [Mycena sp. CBHHK59/15]